MHACSVKLQQTIGRRLFWENGDNQATMTERRHRFWLIIGRPTTFCRRTQDFFVLISAHVKTAPYQGMVM